MPLPPLATGTRVGPESEPRHFRIARARRLGEMVIEYEGQDTIRGDSCLILEFAPETLSTRGPDGAVVPNPATTATWGKALKEFADESTAMSLEKSRYVKELRSLWLGGGTAFRVLKVVPNAPVIPYHSVVVPGATPRSGSQSGATPRRGRSSRSASRSGQSRSLADGPQSSSGASRPSPRSRPIRPASEAAAAARARAEDPAYRSRPIRAVAGSDARAADPKPRDAYSPPPLWSSAAMSSMQDELLAMVGQAAKEQEVAQPAAPLSNSPAMNSAQDELHALVSSVKVAGELSETEQRAQRLAEEKSADSDASSRQRIGLLALGALGLIVFLKMCFGG